MSLNVATIVRNIDMKTIWLREVSLLKTACPALPGEVSAKTGIKSKELIEMLASKTT